MSLFNKSCVVMFEAEDKASGNHLIPNDISNSSGQIDVADWSCDSSYIGHGNGKEMTIGSSSNAVAQDLMPKFEIIVIENENETDSKVNEQEACDLSKMSMELSPLSMVVATEEGVTPSNNVSAIVVMNPSMEAQRFTPLPTFSASQDPVDLSNDS